MQSDIIRVYHAHTATYEPHTSLNHNRITQLRKLESMKWDNTHHTHCILRTLPESVNVVTYRRRTISPIICTLSQVSTKQGIKEQNINT
jgi:hypothetical protein